MTQSWVRRALLRAIVAGSCLALAGCGDAVDTPDDGHDDPAPRAVRKSASAMSPAEIDRFKRAFEFAVHNGYFDAFNDSHYDHHRNRHHGADVLATSPMTVEFMATSWGHRLLPWHRSFLIEAEAMLRAALRARNEAEGGDPTEADLVFIPYWDAAHDQALPDWVLAFQPGGGTAIVPPGLPPTHAGHGKPVGDRYDIVFGRWPGGNPVFDSLQTPDYVARILAKTSFEELYDALDATPEIVVQNYLAAQAGLQTLAMKLPDDPAVQTLLDAFAQPPGQGSAGPELTNALLEIGWRSAVELRAPTPDLTLVDAVDDVYSLFNFVPHLRMHLYAGGLAPDDADLRGTVTYFQELAVDPVFWMLHGELDRYWYTWQQTHDDDPPLTGDDAVFVPLPADDGAWYGGGDTYSLAALTDRDSLPYTYDALFAP